MGFVELRTRSFMAAGEQFDFTNGTFTWQRNRAQAKLYHNQFAGGVLRPPELLKAQLLQPRGAQDTGYNRSFPQKSTIVCQPPGNERTCHKSPST